MVLKVMGKLNISLILCLLFIAFGISTVAQDDVRARVAVYELNIRDDYNDNGQVIGVYTQGMILNVLGREDEPGNGGIWMYVAPVGGGMDGWVLSAYLEFDEGFILSSVPIMTAQSAVVPEVSVEETAPETEVEAELTNVDGLIGSTRDVVNLRSGPGTGFDVISILQVSETVVFIGRNQSGTWLQAITTGGLQGWLSYTFVNVDGNVSALPVMGEVAATTSSQPVVQGNYTNPMQDVVPNITANVRQIFLRGQELGNNPDVFSKVGDSITASNQFLDPVGTGGLQLHEYTYLQGVVDYFSQTGARDHFSFANTSLAARGGWSSGDVLNPSNAPAGICLQGESPLVCEYRVNRPSVALIMFGTNDIPWVDSNVYRANMERIVQITLDRGIIPVLSTVPDLPNTAWAGRVFEFNDIIRSIAFAYNIPLWDYWLSMQSLPNYGIASDNVHPTWNQAYGGTAIFSADALQYGYNMRNLTALMVLDAIWRNALY